jgi:flagellar hook-length control protein FliK
MMSAKTFLTETCPAPQSAPANATASAAPGTEPSQFQSALAGAATTIDLSLVDALPTVPLLQLLGAKTPVSKAVAVPIPVNQTPANAIKGDSTPADLLQLLTDSATLLPETDDAGSGEAKPELHVEVDDKDVKDKQDEDILAQWMESMVPQGVYAQQAGSQSQGGETGQGERRDGGAAAVTIASLAQQAGASDGKLGADAIAAAAASAAVAASGATGATGVTNAVANAASAAVQLTGAQSLAAAGLADARKVDTADSRDSRDGWINTLNNVAAARSHDAVAPDASKISTPVHDSRWADAIAHRLVMMARDGGTVAQLKLVPQDLGPLDIQITVKDGEANVHFGAANAETRAALESSMPRLRELLSASGLQLANASVSQQSAGQPGPQRTAAGNGPVGAVEEAEAAPAKAISTSLLDIYA